MAKKTYLIPFDEKGNQMHYADPHVHANGYTHSKDWREPFEFIATLEYQTYHRGRSAAYFEFKEKVNGHSYTVFLKEFEGMVKTMVCGRVRGRFTFIKRGQNYGTQLIKAF